MRKFYFLKSMCLYIKILDFMNYIEEYSIYEKSENQDILDFITDWQKKLEASIKEILCDYFSHKPEIESAIDINFVSNQLNHLAKSFKSIVSNMKYIPIEPPSPAIKFMVNEIIVDELIDDIKLKDIYYKTISELNFSESKLKEPNFYDIIVKSPKDKKRKRENPNVLSMTALYRDNPLMWPLIFHEYGHRVHEYIQVQNYYPELINDIMNDCRDIYEDYSQVKGLVEEVFSDLFAINCYNINYFVSFYFHEIMLSNEYELLDFNGSQKDSKQHPPSAMRIEYMLAELNRRGFSQDDILIKILSLDQKLANNLYYKKCKLLPKDRLLISIIYIKISDFFEEKKFIISKKKISIMSKDNLYQNLRNRRPIGTSYNINKSLDEALFSDGNFDVEINNNIQDIIYSGWKFLLLDIIDNFYVSNNFNEYLTNCCLKNDEIFESALNNQLYIMNANKIKKFLKEYNFLLSNIKYSIETSMIVSNYKKSHAKLNNNEKADNSNQNISDYTFLDSGGILGKKSIIKRLKSEDEDKIVITPILSSKQIQPASIDLRLGPDFMVLKIGKMTHLEPLKKPKTVEREVRSYADKYKILNKKECFILHPHEFVLGSTLEYISLPSDIAGRLEGRSSWGRLGILIHITAGYIDPGFCGNITFELYNMGKVPIPLYPGIRIAQLAFHRVNGGQKYSGKYQESFGIVSSRYFDDYEFKLIRNMAHGDIEYENLAIDILESVDNRKGLPPIGRCGEIPYEFVEALAEIYRRKHEGDM